VPVKNLTSSLIQLKTVLALVLAVCFLLASFASFCQSSPTGRTRTPSDSEFHTLNAQDCNGSLGDPIVNFTFGAGVNAGNSFGGPLPSSVTNMQYVANMCPNDGSYTITNYSTACFSSAWHTVTDHTGDANGYYMLVNASYTPSDFYVQQVDGLCSGTTYQFSSWVVNVLNKAGISPNITFSIEKTDGTVLQSYNSGDIPVTTSPTWKQYGMYFTTPIGISSVVIRMRNNAPGGNGNDIGLDDITFRPAGPLTRISVSGAGDSLNVCGASVPLSATVESCYVSDEYQWQKSANNGAWVNVPGANSTSYMVPVQPPGKYKYRLLVSGLGNIGVSNCRVSSNVFTVVVVPPPVRKSVDSTICQGQSYTLPSGTKVSVAGDYLDTARYSFGCDSLITQLHLLVQSPVFVNKDTSICKGQTYTLPNGIVVSTPGIYKDTLKYVVTGCDSLIRSINLTIKLVSSRDSSVLICNGDKLTLPWGQTVSTSGVYSDTLRYVAGCDSLIRNVHVHVTVATSQTIERFICPGESYTLPSGAVAKTPGNYVDTLRTPIGCDSIITYLKLSPAPPPTIQLSKSNDVNCTLGISKLTASGGAKYVWSPAESLDNPYIRNPVASPSATTTYKVLVATSEGCTGQDTITVFVSPELAKNGIEIPNAFTPNGDGRNDCFSARFLGYITNLKLSVYDRWGNRVFYTTNPSQCWDGSNKGKQLQSDVFVYQLSATTMCGDIVKQGTVTLIR
jgi:gliding motility-associated-like protein